MRLVDHEARRREIAEVALDLIAREGLEATTLNRIAREMGASVRIVTHYFDDKDSLLLAAYRLMAGQARDHIAAEVARNPTNLVGLLMALCGTDEETLKRWKAYVAFWGKADRDPALGDEQRRASQETQELIGKVIDDYHEAQETSPQLAMELLSMVYGVSVLRILNPDNWTASAVREAFERAIERSRIGNGSGGGT